MSVFKVGDKAVVLTQCGTTETHHQLAEGSIVTIASVHDDCVMVRGVSANSGLKVTQMLDFDELGAMSDGDSCCHYFVDTEIIRDTKTTTGYTWDVTQNCRKCDERRNIVVHKLGWGYCDGEGI